MRVWLRLTHLFGLPEGHHPDDLMQEALGPVLRAAWQDVVEAPLPEPIAKLVQELARRERPIPSLERPQSLSPAPGLRPHGRPRRLQRATQRADRLGAVLSHTVEVLGLRSGTRAAAASGFPRIADAAEGARDPPAATRVPQRS